MPSWPQSQTQGSQVRPSSYKSLTLIELVAAALAPTEEPSEVKEGRGWSPCGMGALEEAPSLPQPGYFPRRCEWPVSARKHVPRVHTGRDSGHETLAANAFPLLAGHRCLIPAIKCAPCVHMGRGFRQSSPSRAGRCQKVSPVSTRETSFPTRDSPTRAFSLLAWHLCWADARKSPPRVHTGRDSRHWLARRAIELQRGGAAGPSRRPHAGRPPSHGSRCPGTPLRPIPFY